MARRIAKLRQLFTLMGAHPYHIILPIGLSFLAAASSGIGLGLLIPLARGVASGDFSFVEQVPVLGSVIAAIFERLGIPNTDRPIFLIIVIFALAAQLGHHSIAFANHVFVSYRNSVFYRNVSTALYRRYLSFGKQFYDSESQGKLQTVLSYPNDVLFFLYTIQQIATALSQVAARFVVMLLISWPLTLMGLLAAPVLALGIRWKARTITEKSTKRHELMVQLGKERYNVLTGIALVKSYGNESRMLGRFAEMQERLKEVTFGLQVVHGLADPMQKLILLTAFVAVLLFGRSFMTEMSVENVSMVAIFFYAASGMLPFFAELGKASFAFAESAVPVSELLRMFDDKGKFLVPQGNKEFQGLKHAITFHNLTFGYTEEHPVLQELSFSVEKDSTVALVGPSGAGKTSTVSLLLRLYDVSPGAILMDGQDIRSFTHASLQRHMAYVSQEPVLFNDTLRYNLTFGLDREVTDADLKEVAEKARLTTFFENLPKGWDTEVGDRGVRLSGGEKQRISIARALLKRADILILDEATSSLDSQTERLIQEAVDAALKGRTAIVIAHRLSTIRNADKIVVLREGRVVEEGTMAALQERKGLFSKLWEAQQFY
jgi:subfamily B ATP-binding cassette protein MsbA